MNPNLLDQDYEQMVPIFQVNYDRWLPVARSEAILDFGCGYGTFLKYLKALGYTNLHGIDPDFRCAESARKNGQVPITFTENTKEFLEKHVNSFSFISALTVIGYFERDQILSYFTRLRLALKPGGHLLLELNNSSALTGSIDYIQDPYFKSQYTDISLVDILRSTGFEIEFIGGLRLPKKGMARFAWLGFQWIWFQWLRCIYILERGAIERNPRIFHSRIVAVAKRPLADVD